MYINNEPEALVSYRQNTALLKNLLADTEYRFGGFCVYFRFCLFYLRFINL